MATQRSKSMYEKEKKVVKINKAKPAPNFKKLHSQWQKQFDAGVSKAKKPSTMPIGVGIPTMKEESSKLSSEAPPPKQVLSKIKPSEPVRRKVVQIKPVEHEDVCEFKADPDSLAAILDNKPTETKRQPPRLSLYDRLAIAQKHAEDHPRPSIYSRTPLKSVDNVISNGQEMTPKNTRKSIYDVLSAKQLQTTAQKTSERWKQLNSNSNKKVTWSARFVQSPTLDSLSDIPKQKLFQNDTDEMDESLLRKIELAEQRLDLENKAKTQLNATYVTRPNRDASNISLNFDDPTPLLNDTESLSITHSFKTRPDTPPPSLPHLADHRMLPRMTGVTKIMATPDGDDSVCNLLGGLKLSPQLKQTSGIKNTLEQTFDGSPALPIPMKRRKSKTQLSTCNSLQTFPAEKADFFQKTKFSDCNENLSSQLAETNHSSSNTQALEPNLVDDNKNQTENQMNNLIINPRDSCSESDASLALCSTIQTVDELIGKSRRRSQALVADFPSADPELNQELQQILAEQQKLELRKKMLEKKLMAARSACKATSQEVSARHNVLSPSRQMTGNSLEQIPSLLEEHSTLQPQCVLSGDSISETQDYGTWSVDSDRPVLANSIIISGPSEDAIIGLSHIHEEADLTFMPPPMEIKTSTGLQAISTAACKISKSKVRKSVSLMTFSPSLNPISEQFFAKLDHSSDSCVMEEIHPSSTLDKFRSSKVDSIIEAEPSIISNKPNPTMLSDSFEANNAVDDLSTSMDVSESLSLNSKTIPTSIYNQSGLSKNIAHIPAITSINHLQGCHLLASGQKMAASVSPCTLHAQSKLIGSIDSVNNGLPCEHYQSLMDQLIHETICSQKKEDIVSSTALTDKCTPRATCSDGTIKIYSCEKTPEKFSSPPNSSDTPDWLSNYKNRVRNEVKGRATPTGFRVRIGLDKYREALLDDEVSIYMCTSLVGSTESKRRLLTDPVAYSLDFGDFQHFIPISLPEELLPVEGSAFSLLGYGHVSPDEPLYGHVSPDEPLYGHVSPDEPL
ncbi:uro-adherence factor A-like [Watersipora subatra]|uniref:uro-adherence factor A-like n=1 Tax=Watersipora subatra TaxID=2589382 RepID=UPI00355BE638